MEANYNRWQLLHRPIRLETFNRLPHLTSSFFDYSLRLDRQMLMPLRPAADSGQVEFGIWAWEAVRYKYKLYKASDHDVSTAELLQLIC